MNVAPYVSPHRRRARRRLYPAASVPTGAHLYTNDEGGRLTGEYDNNDTPCVITRASDNRIRWRWDQADPFGTSAPNANPASLGAACTGRSPS